MADLEIIKFEPMTIYGIEAEGGVSGASEAFARLEEFVGEKTEYFSASYGLFWSAMKRYFVGTRPTSGSLTLTTGLRSELIPGGQYATNDVVGWEQELETLGQGQFGVLVNSSASSLAKRSEEAGHQRDDNRPEVEIYNRSGDLKLLYPVK